MSYMPNASLVLVSSEIAIHPAEVGVIQAGMPLFAVNVNGKTVAANGADKLPASGLIPMLGLAMTPVRYPCRGIRMDTAVIQPGQTTVQLAAIVDPAIATSIKLYDPNLNQLETAYLAVASIDNSTGVSVATLAGTALGTETLVVSLLYPYLRTGDTAMFEWPGQPYAGPAPVEDQLALLTIATETNPFETDHYDFTVDWAGKSPILGINADGFIAPIDAGGKAVAGNFMLVRAPSADNPYLAVSYSR